MSRPPGTLPEAPGKGLGRQAIRAAALAMHDVLVREAIEGAGNAAAAVRADVNGGLRRGSQEAPDRCMGDRDSEVQCCGFDSAATLTAWRKREADEART